MEGDRIGYFGRVREYLGRTGDRTFIDTMYDGTILYGHVCHGRSRR